jgi:CheY-like chemotaxis protein
MPQPPEAGSILLVDDAPDNLRVLYEILHGRGYAVRVAPDGFAALRSVHRQRPDVIVLDALMPGMDGFETCRQLKEDIETRDIPVIFLTGLNDSEHIVRGFQVGGVDYVTKPVVAEELLARVETHMQTARLLADTRTAIDSTGHAVAAFDEQFVIHWATPQAQCLLQPLMDANDRLPLPIRQWLQSGGDRPYALRHGGGAPAIQPARTGSVADPASGCVARARSAGARAADNHARGGSAVLGDPGQDEPRDRRDTRNQPA